MRSSLEGLCVDGTTRAGGAPPSPVTAFNNVAPAPVSGSQHNLDRKTATDEAMWFPKIARVKAYRVTSRRRPWSRLSCVGDTSAGISG